MGIHINTNILFPSGKWIFYRVKSDHNLSGQSSLTISRPQCLHTMDQEPQPYLTDWKTKKRGRRIAVIELMKELIPQAPI